MFKVLKIILLLLVGIPLICVGALFLYFGFYTGDLPDVGQLSVYDGSTPGEVNKLPWGETAKLTVISSNQMGYVQDATLAAEGELDSEGVYSRAYHSLTEDRLRSGAGNYSTQISRDVLIGHYRLSHRAIAELRYAHQLERRFTPEQIFAIHQNIVDLGNEQYGIEAASQFYFGVPAAGLSVADAALLAGMIRSPNKLSPYKHPDRALERRNEILDRMLQQRKITEAERDTAKFSPLGVKMQPPTAR